LGEPKDYEKLSFILKGAHTRDGSLSRVSPMNVTNVTASVRVKLLMSIGMILLSWSLTFGTSEDSVEAFDQARLKTSSAIDCCGAISVKGDTSSIFRNSTAPFSWLTNVTIVCNIRTVVSGEL
jgi:hypothetical protein